MLFTIPSLVLAFAALATAQTATGLDSTTDIPSCALGCIVTAIQKDTTCGIFDTGCQCTAANVALISGGSTACVTSKCSTADAEKTLLVTGNICAKQLKEPESTTLDLAALSSKYASTGAASAAATSVASASAVATSAAVTSAAKTSAASASAAASAATSAKASSAAAVAPVASAAASCPVCTASTVTVTMMAAAASAASAAAGTATTSHAATAASSGVVMFTGAANALAGHIGGVVAALGAAALVL